MYNRGYPQSGPGAVGPGHMAGGIPHSAHVVPLAAPRPGYPVPVANLKLSTPPPSTSPPSQAAGPLQMGQVPQALRVTRPQADAGAPRMPPPIYQTAVPRPSVPSAPHPLQPPMTPITPVFARPSKTPSPSDVKFSEAIIRGNSEDDLLPKREGERGDFWRRFSMVAKEEKKPSSWLVKTQNGYNRLSRWVCVIGISLLICSGIGIGIWYYVAHNSTSNRPPTAVGGSADETAGPSAPTPGAQGSSAALVTPTFTVARRGVPDSTPTALAYIGVPPEHAVPANGLRHKKKHQVRNF